MKKRKWSLRQFEDKINPKYAAWVLGEIFSEIENTENEEHGDLNQEYFSRNIGLRTRNLERKNLSIMQSKYPELKSLLLRKKLNALIDAGFEREEAVGMIYHGRI
jgi:hypothetical protein